MTEEKRKEGEWKDRPTSFHLSTIGIDEAFIVSPPPLSSLPSSQQEEEEVSEPDTETGPNMKINIKDKSSQFTAYEYTTWEIVGRIKLTPEDFIVREIGGVPRSSQSSKKTTVGTTTTMEATVADLTDAHSLPLPPPTDIPNTTEDVKMATKDIEDSNASATETETTSASPSASSNPPPFKKMKSEIENDNDAQTKDKKQEIPSSDPMPMESMESIEESTREGVIRSLLKNDSLYDDIQHLHDEAFKDLTGDGDGMETSANAIAGDANANANNESKAGSEIANEEKAIIIPPILDDVVVLFKNEVSQHWNSNSAKKNRNRGTFHRTLKMVFPLLKSMTMDSPTTVSAIDRTVDAGKKTREEANKVQHLRPVKIEKDKTFHKLVPFLLYPQQELEKLYKFRNSPVVSTNRHNSNSTRQGRKQKRRFNNKKTENGESKATEDAISSSSSTPNTSETYEVVLHLKRDISRDMRKDIHHIIAACCKDLATSTKNDVPIINLPDCDATENTTTTTAIIVQWSRQAQGAMLKRKRKESAGNVHSNRNGGDRKQTQKHQQHHTLCILRKRRQEHLSAIHHLTAALKCRQSDIGLAGIKDMKAVTYQYCTLRDISPSRARRGNEYLKYKGMELGNFTQVPWLLNQGDLKGNSFEVTLRDLKQVMVKSVSEGVLKECFIPCDKSHIVSMVDRIAKHGFVNFYGEQRVGNAGPSAGVRAGDIGHAMLQKDFLRAIDLLMTGRCKDRGGNFVESEDIRKMRQVYADTEGDPALTLAAFPRGNVLGRERAVLQGLRRYGRDKPLDALRCLHYGVRIFWINAYQSRIFNHMASERILKLGKAPVLGDLYLDSETSEVKVIVSDPSAVHISQIVLPLPGYNVMYPTNIIGDQYRNILKLDGVSFTKHTVDEATAKGSYRKLVVIPDSFKWEQVSDSKSQHEQNSISDAKFSFSLPSGSYATMCLRELMSTTMAR